MDSHQRAVPTHNLPLESVADAEEKCDAGTGGLAVNRVSRTCLDQSPIHHHADGSPEAESFLQVMRHEQNAQPQVPLEVKQEAAHLPAKRLMQGREGFIKEEQTGARGQSPGQGHALPLTSAEASGFPVSEMGDAQPLLKRLNAGCAGFP